GRPAVDTRDRRRHRIDLRKTELVAAHAGGAREPGGGFGGFDFDVADRRHASRHAGPSREEADHRELAPGSIDDGLRRVHAAAAFGVDCAPAASEAGYLAAELLVGGELAGVELRVAAAQVQAVERFGQVRVGDRAELDQLGAAGADEVEVVGIVETE